jgi:hypothetical protein
MLAIVSNFKKVIESQSNSKSMCTQFSLGESQDYNLLLEKEKNTGFCLQLFDSHGYHPSSCFV